VGLDGACALDADGFLHCWGAPADGAPTDVELLDFDMETWHGCAIPVDGAPVCWPWLEGPGDDGLAALEPPSEPVIGVATASSSTCWLLESGMAECGGFDRHGQTEPPAEPLASIVGGGASYCAVLSAGVTVRCWGLDGEGNVEDVPTVTPQALDAGGDTTCVIDAGDVATCYGLTQLFSDRPNRYSPEGAYIAVGADGQPCFVDAAGGVDCAYDGGPRCDPQAGPFHAVASYAGAACAAADGGGLLCWMADPEILDEPGRCLVGEPSSLPWLD
jgi:hypothetical protein